MVKYLHFRLKMTIELRMMSIQQKKNECISQIRDFDFYFGCWQYIFCKKGVDVAYIFLRLNPLAASKPIENLSYDLEKSHLQQCAQTVYLFVSENRASHGDFCWISKHEENLYEQNLNAQIVRTVSFFSSSVILARPIYTNLTKYVS